MFWKSRKESASPYGKPLSRTAIKIDAPPLIDTILRRIRRAEYRDTLDDYERSQYSYAGLIEDRDRCVRARASQEIASMCDRDGLLSVVDERAEKTARRERIRIGEPRVVRYSLNVISDEDLTALVAECERMHNKLKEHGLT
ncbi:hypothetical protein [Rhizobium phage RHph_X2_26]|nr:hypothetical protein [Rhizobium phage RHph_X2_26]